jgi:outer membrane receptor protein involved in Fe transport
VFAQATVTPVRRLGLNVGARLDWGGDLGARVSPRAAITVMPMEGSTLQLSYAHAFRGPTPYELDERDPSYRIAPETLRAESVNGAELEWRQRIRGATVAARGYVARYSDFVAERPATAEEIAEHDDELVDTVDPSQVVVNDNLDAIGVVGGGATLTLAPIPGLTVAGSLDVVRARRAGEPLGLSPSWFGNLRVAWRSPAGRSLALAARVVGQRRVMLATIVYPNRAGEQLDLRLTGIAPLPVAGLSARAVAGYAAGAFSPIAMATTDDGTEALELVPGGPRLLGFVELHYTFGR